MALLSDMVFSVCCVFAVSSEPSAVSGLAVTSRTFGSLGLSWQAGPGRTQRFRLQLWDPAGTSVRFCGALMSSIFIIFKIFPTRSLLYIPSNE